MYEFHYDYIKSKFHHKSKLWFTGTDSLKAQWQVWDILQGASSLRVKFKRQILVWYDKLFPS